MLIKIPAATAIMMLGISQLHAQPIPNLEAMSIDQQLYGACMAARKNQGFCNCTFEASNKNVKGPKFKRIWYAFQVNLTTTEAERLRSQLTPSENQIFNGQLQAADIAQGACNTQFGIR